MRKLVFISISIFCITCTTGSSNAASEEAKLISTSKAWSIAAQTNNIEDILSYWAEDAIVLAPGETAHKGKAAIRAMVEGSKDIPGFKISWEPIQATVSASGDMAWLLEKNTVSFIDSSGNRVTQVNKAVTVWKKNPDGAWKNIVDIWNADQK